MKLPASLIEAYRHEKSIYDLPDTISRRERRQLASGVPFQKIIGYVQFSDVKIFVKSKVFIPRYETEELVVFAAKHIQQSSSVLDLCTGSGFIGLSIKRKTNASVTMSDISAVAVATAKQNAARNNLQVKIIKSNLFASVPGKFDFILCNPPYIPRTEKLPRSVTKFEPARALWGGTDGNNYYRRILADVPQHINPGGMMIFEISPANAPFLRAHGYAVLDDINGKARIAYKHY